MKNEPFMTVNVKKGLQYELKSIFDTFEYNFIHSEYAQQDIKVPDHKLWDQIGSTIGTKI